MGEGEGGGGRGERGRVEGEARVTMEAESCPASSHI